MDNIAVLPSDFNIDNKIYTIRGVQVMIYRDLALLYGVDTRVINQSVKRNIDRFPKDFCFQLSDDEFNNWISQFVISNKEKMGIRKRPFAFTEQGVAMLSGVLRSKTAVQISLQIIHAFVGMRKFIINNAQIFQRLDSLEMKLAHDRFLIIDQTELYHIGASLKDLGKKWFAFSKMNPEVLPLLHRLNTPCYTHKISNIK